MPPLEGDLLYQHNKIPKKKFTAFNHVIINHGRKCNDKNLKHEIEFMIKSNESFAENKLKKRF